MSVTSLLSTPSEHDIISMATDSRPPATRPFGRSFPARSERALVERPAVTVYRFSAMAGAVLS